MSVANITKLARELFARSVSMSSTTNGKPHIKLEFDTVREMQAFEDNMLRLKLATRVRSSEKNWTDHGGKGMPSDVNGKTIVRVQYRSGLVSNAVPAKMFERSPSPLNDGRVRNHWIHIYAPNDIVRYIIEP